MNEWVALHGLVSGLELSKTSIEEEFIVINFTHLQPAGRKKKRQQRVKFISTKLYRRNTSCIQQKEIWRGKEREREGKKIRVIILSK